MSDEVNFIQIHKRLRLNKRAGSDNWHARLTLPNGKRLTKTTKTDVLETSKKAALRLYSKVAARIQNKLDSVATVHNLNRAFNALLDELGLKVGAHDTRRTQYSRPFDNRTETIVRHYSKYTAAQC